MIHPISVKRKGVAGSLALLFSCLLAYVWLARAPVASPQLCAGRGTVLVVKADERLLCLCREETLDASFVIAIGRGGTGKEREGDGKTPLGEYSLGEPRASSRYALFIPVGYPTVEQRQKGFTGGAIGVHGPHVAFRWLGRATVWADWTLGCVAVGTSGDIKAVAAWVRRHRVSRIVIL